MVKLTRREGLAWLGAVPLGAALGFGAQPTSWAAEPGLAQALPFDPPAPELARSSPKKAYAFWHVYRISTDNRPPSEDRYARDYLNVEGMKGRFAKEGGFLRERPIPRPPRRSADWLIEDMEEDVRLAASIGLDGFFFNIVSLDPKTAHWQSLEAMLEAVERANSNFRLILTIDVSSLKQVPVDQLVDFVVKFADRSALLRHSDHRLVMAAFRPEGWSLDWWQTWLSKLRDRGIEVFFIPIVLNWRKAVDWGLLNIGDMLGAWGPHTLSAIPQLERHRQEVKAAGKLWMPPVLPQDFRPKGMVYSEADNSRMFRSFWESAIDQDADWVNVVTWNDYSECTEITPSSGIQYSFYDLCAYYVSWFKGGRAPEIRKDVLFYFHRVMPAAPITVRGRRVPGQVTIRGAQPPTDEVELLGFLTAPGRLEIEIAGETTRAEVGAGMHGLRAPLRPGLPRFRLQRGGETVIDFTSAFEIRANLPFPDLLYRGGSSSRPVVPMVANEPFGLTAR
jgi:hypothetical protein